MGHKVWSLDPGAGALSGSSSTSVSAALVGRVAAVLALGVGLVVATGCHSPAAAAGGIIIFDGDLDDATDPPMFRGTPEPELYRMNADGSDLRQLTTDGGSRGRWSVVTDRLVYQSEGVQAMNLDGSDRRVVVADDGWVGSGGPAWLADGKHVSFHAVAPLFMRTFSLDYESAAGLDDITPASLDEAAEVEASPDGQFLVFVPDLLRQQLLLTDPNGTVIRSLGEQTSGGAHPRWSPDSTKIAFDLDADVVVLDVASGELQVTADASRPVWSPDGARIAFSRRNAYVIWIMDADGSHGYSTGQTGSPSDWITAGQPETTRATALLPSAPFIMTKAIVDQVAAAASRPPAAAGTGSSQSASAGGGDDDRSTPTVSPVTVPHSTAPTTVPPPVATHPVTVPPVTQPAVPYTVPTTSPPPATTTPAAQWPVYVVQGELDKLWLEFADRVGIDPLQWTGTVCDMPLMVADHDTFSCVVYGPGQAVMGTVGISVTGTSFAPPTITL